MLQTRCIVSAALREIDDLMQREQSLFRKIMHLLFVAEHKELFLFLFFGDAGGSEHVDLLNGQNK